MVPRDFPSRRLRHAIRAWRYRRRYPWHASVPQVPADTTTLIRENEPTEDRPIPPTETRHRIHDLPILLTLLTLSGLFSLAEVNLVRVLLR